MVYRHKKGGKCPQIQCLEGFGVPKNPMTTSVVEVITRDRKDIVFSIRAPEAPKIVCNGWFFSIRAYNGVVSKVFHTGFHTSQSRGRWQRQIKKS